MEQQFIHFPVPAEMGLYPEALELGDDEGSALIGAELVGWFAPNYQRKLLWRDNLGRAFCRSAAGGLAVA